MDSKNNKYQKLSEIEKELENLDVLEQNLIQCVENVTIVCNDLEYIEKIIIQIQELKCAEANKKLYEITRFSTNDCKTDLNALKKRINKLQCVLKNIRVKD